MRTAAVQVVRHGGPEVLEPTELELGALAPDALRVEQAAIGLNFTDVYLRTGLYPGPDVPFVPGMEGAGEVVEVGAQVSDFRVGDRVAYAGQVGAYAAVRDLPAARAVHVPDGLELEAAAAVLLKGLTAWYLLHFSHRLAAGEWALVHAAAGGTGQLLCCWAKHLGASVIGAVGTASKAARVRDLGVEHVVCSAADDWPDRVRGLSGGEGVHVAYDPVGATTFAGTLAALRRRGSFVSFGNASGPAPAVEPLLLMQHGSLTFTRPHLRDFIVTSADLRAGAAAVFHLVAEGVLPVSIGARLPLAEAGRAQAELEGRRTTGSTLLVP